MGETHRSEAGVSTPATLTHYVNGKPRRGDKAFIQPPQGNTVYTWLDGDKTGRDAIQHYMQYTVESVQKYPDRLYGCFVYNPRWGVDNGVMKEAPVRIYVRNGGGYRDEQEWMEITA